MKARVALLVLAVLASACTVRSDETEILPWLKLRSTYRGFGGFGGSTENAYYFRYFGLWWKLDATAVTVVAPDLALASRSGDVAMVHRGRWSPVPLCTRHRDHAMPRVEPPAIDCMHFTWSASAAPGDPPTGVTITRVGSEGEQVARWQLSVDGTGRTFSSGASLRYYDDRGMPYILVQNRAAARDFRAMPRDCALATPRPDGGTALVEGRASMDYRECERREAWQAIAGRPLRDGHERSGDTATRKR